MLALVVDDSRAMRAILRGMLKDSGFEVVEAGNGAEALAQLESRPELEVALVDWNMPVMDGYEFIQKARANPEYRRIRILMVTTETEAEQVSKALAAGADEYLMKPFTKEVLLAKLSLMDVYAEPEA